MEAVLSRFRRAKDDHLKSKKLPFVCVTWAQSLDGYIAARPRVQTIISCAESMELTHELRAAHDSLLVGIGTILADNPRLNVRLSRSAESPRPVILDSQLRTPCNAKFLHIERKNRPLIFSNYAKNVSDSDADKTALEERCVQLSEFADVHRIPSLAQYEGVHIDKVLDALAECNVNSVMVEGGSKVLTNFIEGGYADFMIVTTAPRMFGGGVPAFQSHDDGSEVNKFPVQNLLDPHWERVGTDIVLCGVPAKTVQ